MNRILIPLAAIAVVGACSDQPSASANDAAPAKTEATPAETIAAQGSPADRSAPPAAPVARPALAVDGEGLRLFNPATGSARPLPFGTAQADVMTALALRGPPGTGRQEECGAGPLDFAAWPDGLKLYFQSSKLVGWALDGRAANPAGPPALGTAASIGPGSTRAEPEAAHVATVTQSSLGTEFVSGDMAGVLDGRGPQAKITDMWAGAACVMR